MAEPPCPDCAYVFRNSRFGALALVPFSIARLALSIAFVGLVGLTVLAMTLVGLLSLIGVVSGQLPIWEGVTLAVLGGLWVDIGRSLWRELRHG